jgi:hypothetical protein
VMVSVMVSELAPLMVSVMASELVLMMVLS